MTHWERVRAALRGEAVDRPPISLWRHFFREETSVAGLVDAMVGFQRKFDWDFVKVNPRASFHSEDWGVGLRFSGNDTDAPETVDWPVKDAADWTAIGRRDVRGGVLGEHLEALGRIVKGLDGDVPVLMTVFTPLSIAAQLAGSDEAMARHLRESPAEVHRALEAITETFTGFAQECLGIGTSGLFYATTRWGTYDRLTDAEYAEFGRPYDLRLLEVLPEAELNVLHVCQSNNMLAALADYPVAAFNWDSQDETNVSLGDGQSIVGRPAIGGISHRSVLAEGSPEEVVAEARRTMESMAGTRWMLGSGCTFPPDVPEANLRALRDAVGAA
jgi:uroporphyrinogen decarboxylase